MKLIPLAFVLTLLATGTAVAEPTLKGDITVNTDIVTVGDMFNDPGSLSDTAIFRAPAPGTTGIVPVDDVATAARAIGLTDFDTAGYARIRVMRLTTVVDAPALGRSKCVLAVMPFDSTPRLVSSVLHEFDLPLSRTLDLKPGDTIMFDRAPSEPITLRCGDVELTQALMGHIGNYVSVRVTRPLNPPKVTMAAFEAIDKQAEGR
jgi:hypothetical protein